MGLLRETGKYRVPFEFHGEIVHLKVTKYTTFNDVVHLLTSKAGISKPIASLYAVYEATWDLERKIGGVVRVLAIWRSWGSEMNNFRFVVKQKNHDLSLKSFDQKPVAQAERDIDTVFMNKYRGSESSGTEASTSVKLNLKSFNNSELSFVNTAFHLEKTTLDEKQQTNRKNKTTRMRNFLSLNKKVDKKTMLTKYFSGMKMFNSKSKLGKREKGDGTEYPPMVGGRHVEGCDSSSDHSDIYTKEGTVTSLDNCRYHWEKHEASDTDSDISDDFPENESVSDDESFAFSSDEPVLDVAFVKSSRDSESDEGIDVTSLNSNDLDTAFVEAFQHRCSTFTDTNEHDDVADFERNISTCDYVRRIFGAGEEDTFSVGSQDEEVDSFMRTRLDSF